MSYELTTFWQLLETNYPLGGPRGHLRQLLGTEIVDSLEAVGILKHLRAADRYPCPRSGSDGCPRVVVEREDGTLVAVCGNDPAECFDLELSASDASVLSVSPEVLCEKVGKALRIHTRVEELPGLRNACRVGTFSPDPGIKHAIYFVARSSKRDLAEAVDALRTHAAAQTFAVLMPTERFVTDELRRRAAAARDPLVALLDVVGLDTTGLCALGDPLKIFGGVGQVGVTPAAQGSVVARALVRGKTGTPTWFDLDDAAYRDLVASEGSYEIFADEITKTVDKGKGATRARATKIAAPFFKEIYSAVKKVSNYDPAIEDEGNSGKQTFQRARKVFDIKRGESWVLFKTDTDDKHATYRFDPDASVTFALVFAPRR